MKNTTKQKTAPPTPVKKILFLCVEYLLYEQCHKLFDLWVLAKIQCEKIREFAYDQFLFF